MKERSLGLLATVFLLGLSACAAESAAPASRAAETAATSAAPAPAPRADATSTGAPASIFDVRKPASTIADGTRLHIEGPGVRVTFVAGRTLFIQEAGDDGTCENGSSVVAHRAIEVALDDAPESALVRGARVAVDGIVVTRGGRRLIENASVTVVDATVHEYEPHCDRDSRAIDDEALDAVVVRIAGTTAGAAGEPSAVDGSWAVSTCFGAMARVGTRFVSYEDWAPTWHWVTGVVVRGESSAPRLEPRDAEDIDATGQNDACL